MKQLLFALFFLSISAAQLPFVIIVPSFNNIKWYQNNIDSLLAQEYENFRIIYLDDASNDGMSAAVQAHLIQHPRGNKVQYMLNTTRVGALSNIYTAAWMCEPHEIIVLVDGDDWFENEHVLSFLNNVYANSNVWMTYGQYRRTNGERYASSEIPFHIIQHQKIRQYPWAASHLRTFYAGLFHKIHKEDLLYAGDFFSMAWDLAIMYPMLEMAGSHSKFISRVLYVYNTENPISDCKKNLHLQRTIDRYIRSKNHYAALDRLF